MINRFFIFLILILCVFTVLTVSTRTPVCTGGSELKETEGTVPKGQIRYISKSFKGKQIKVFGTLYFKNKPMNVDLNWIRVENGGSLQIGNPNCPITEKIVINFNGDKTTQDMGIDEADKAALGTKGISVVTGGTIDIYGDYNAKPWTNLDESAKPQSKTIFVRGKTSWKVGDKIVLVNTDYAGVPDTYADLEQDEEHEIATIKQVPCPQTQGESCDRIELKDFIKYLHYGGPEYQGEVAHLTRNILIKGDDSSITGSFGAHIIIRKVEHAIFHGIELKFVGQKGVVGRYPIHFHQLDFAAKGKQVYVKNCALHKTFQRCVVIHDSHHIMVENNVAFDVSGSCYFLEDGSETHNTFRGNLGAKVADVKKAEERIIPSDVDASVYWIANPTNNFEGNVASGGTFGFWFVMPEKPNGLSAAKYANDDAVKPRLMPLGKFDNNVAHSARKTGVMVDELQDAKGFTSNGNYEPRQGPYGDKDPKVPVIAHFNGVIAYKNRRHGFWARGKNMHFNNFKLFDNSRGFQAVVMPSVLENSLFVCETPNIGTPIERNGIESMGRNRPNIWRNSQPIWGYENYDAGGPQFQRNNIFKNCKTNKFRPAAAFGSLPNGPNVLAPMNRYEKLLIENSQHFYWERYPNAYRDKPETDHAKFLTVLDNDGTSTGKMGTWVLPTESFHSYKINGCEKRDAENTTFCPPTYEGRVHINIENKNVGETDFAGTNQDAKTPWIRVNWYHLGDKKKEHGLGSPGNDASSKTRTRYRANLPARSGYAVRFPHPTPPQLNIRVTGMAHRDWVVVCLPYPNDKVEITRKAWPQATFTKVASLKDLVADSYTFVSNQICVRVENTISTGATSYRGFVYQSSWNAQVDIKHTCSKGGCKVNGDPPILDPISYESIYKADLCGTNTKTYGTAFFGFDPKTRSLSFQIYHGLGDEATAAHLHYKKDNKVAVDLGIPFSPMEGSVTLTYRQYVALYNGELYLNIHSKKNQGGELKGDVGCYTQANAQCYKPPDVPTQKPCSLKDDNNGMVITLNGDMKQVKDNKIASWSSWSWGGNHGISITKETTDVPCGTGAMKIKTRDGAFSPHHDNNGITITKDYALQFWVKSLSGPLQLSIGLRDTKTWLKSVDTKAEYVQYWAITGDEWTRVKIMVTDLGITTDTKVDRLQIRVKDSWKLKEDKEWMISDFRFVPNGKADTLGPGATVKPVNYVAKNCFKDPKAISQTAADKAAADKAAAEKAAAEKAAAEKAAADKAAADKAAAEKAAAEKAAAEKAAAEKAAAEKAAAEKAAAEKAAAEKAAAEKAAAEKAAAEKAAAEKAAAEKAAAEKAAAEKAAAEKAAAEKAAAEKAAAEKAAAEKAAADKAAADKAAAEKAAAEKAAADKAAAEKAAADKAAAEKAAADKAAAEKAAAEKAAADKAAAEKAAAEKAAEKAAADKAAAEKAAAEKAAADKAAAEKAAAEKAAADKAAAEKAAADKAKKEAEAKAAEAKAAEAKAAEAKAAEEKAKQEADKAAADKAAADKAAAEKAAAEKAAEAAESAKKAQEASEKAKQAEEAAEKARLEKQKAETDAKLMAEKEKAAKEKAVQSQSVADKEEGMANADKPLNQAPPIILDPSKNIPETPPSGKVDPVLLNPKSNTPLSSETIPKPAVGDGSTPQSVTEPSVGKPQTVSPKNLPITLSLTLKGDISTFNPDKFATFIASFLKIDKSRVKVLSFKAGSVIATIQILPVVSDTNTQTTTDLAETLTRNVAAGTVASQDVSIASASVVDDSPNSNKAQTTSGSSKPWFQQPVFIALISVGMLVVVGVVVVLIIILLRNKKETPSTESAYMPLEDFSEDSSILGKEYI